MRAFGRDLIRGGHYGQRSCEPHLKAEHMAAPTKPATGRFLLPTRSRPHMAHSVVSLLCNNTSAIGAGCVKTCAGRECAESFSPFSSFGDGWQCCSLLIHRSQEGNFYTKVRSQSFHTGSGHSRHGKPSIRQIYDGFTALHRYRGGWRDPSIGGRATRLCRYHLLP